MAGFENMLDDAESFLGNSVMPDPTQLLNCLSYLNFHPKAYSEYK